MSCKVKALGGCMVLWACRFVFMKQPMHEQTSVGEPSYAYGI